MEEERELDAEMKKMREEEERMQALEAVEVADEAMGYEMLQNDVKE